MVDSLSDWLGRKQLGQELSLSVACIASENGTISWPSSPPILDVWKNTNLVVGGLKMPKDDGTATGRFCLKLFLDGRFTTGYYEAVMRWTNGTYLGVKFSRWAVIPGGNVDGSIIAMTQHELPHARFLVSQADSGKLFRLKNPSVS